MILQKIKLTRVGTAVRVVVPGPVGGRWTVTRRPDGWILAGDPDPPAVTEVAIDADALWRLATRGITPRDAEQRGRRFGGTGGWPLRR